jgi:hypothetical protein
LITLDQAWTRFWFQSTPTTPLEIIRIGVAVAMLINYSLATPYLFTIWGDAGWIPYSSLFADDQEPWSQSLFYYLWAPWQLAVLHGVFLFSCAALMLGWRAAWIKWIVLIGQISYANRNWVVIYGVDSILSCLLFVLCLAPIGKAISLDRVRAVRAAKLRALDVRPPGYASPWAGACIRLIQIQMAILFFFSAYNKMEGADWRAGVAVWKVFIHPDFYNRLMLDLFSAHYWLVIVATYAVLLIEFAYPFLIWQRRTRPYMLASAIFLHLQFGTWMGMPYFSFVMVMGHLSFLRQEWLVRLGEWWKRKAGSMELLYDGHCAFCIRSMARLLAFDGLGQVTARDFRTNPSSHAPDTLDEGTLYLVLPDSRAFTGVFACRQLALRVPGLWWMVPFLYVPLLSRTLGPPLFAWIAAKRDRAGLRSKAFVVP